MAVHNFYLHSIYPKMVYDDSYPVYSRSATAFFHLHQFFNSFKKKHVNLEKCFNTANMYYFKLNKKIDPE